MGQDRQDLIVGVRIEGGVKQDDPLGSTKTGKISVCVSGPLARVHLKHPFHPETCLFHEMSNSTIECSLCNRLKPVKPRCNHGRVQPEDESLENTKNHPRPYPPGLPKTVDQDQDKAKDDPPQCGRKDGLLGEV